MLNASASCAATTAREISALKSTVATLEAQVATLQAELASARDNHGGRRLQATSDCAYVKKDGVNLVELLPSLPGADMTRSDGRCSRRYMNFNKAWQACMLEAACVGIVKDNGLPCGRSSRGSLHPFELRGGGLHRGPGTSWVCEARLALSTRQNTATAATVATKAPPGAVNAREGFTFIVLGACAIPGLACKFLCEVRDAIAALRQVFPSPTARPIAVITDGGINSAALLKYLNCDLIHLIPQRVLLSARTTQDGDVRVRKLLAYAAAPFERNVFFDGDTHARNTNVEMLFSALEHFDLATAFECCRLDYTSSGVGYDRSGFMRGWEMQTGVMAYKRGARLDSFWKEATREYESRLSYWSRKSSGEQGAATLALSRVDVRYLPLPPSFNARPFTMLSYLSTFGMPVYHGKDLFQRKNLAGQPAHVESLIAERMLRDWDQTRDILAAQFAPEFLANITRDAALRGARRASPGPRQQWRAEKARSGFGAGARRGVTDYHRLAFEARQRARHSLG